MKHKDCIKYLNPTFILASLFVFMSFISGMILNNGLIVFLTWNMLLAIVVYIISIIVVYLHKKKSHKIWFISSIFIYIIFFPNSFYIITDLIHFQNYEFFNTYPSIYTFHIYDWFVFFVVTIGALVALKLSILSISHVKSVMPKIQKKYEYIGLTILFVLSSAGIYLGRFIRLNSWNIFDVTYIFNAIFDRFSFFIMFVLLFTIIHMIAYILFKEKGE